MKFIWISLLFTYLFPSFIWAWIPSMSWTLFVFFFSSFSLYKLHFPLCRQKLPGGKNFSCNIKDCKWEQSYDERCCWVGLGLSASLECLSINHMGTTFLLNIRVILVDTTELWFWESLLNYPFMARYRNSRLLEKNSFSKKPADPIMLLYICWALEMFGRK